MNGGTGGAACGAGGTARREQIDAVFVVLGAAVRPGGVASPALHRRVAHARACAQQVARAAFVVTGGEGRHPPSEARVMRDLLVAMGVDAARVHLEERATRTAHSARYCAPLLRALGCARVVLVTDAYHQRRARLAFRRMGIEATSASPPLAPPSGLRERVRRSAREWIGLAWYALTLR